MFEKELNIISKIKINIIIQILINNDCNALKRKKWDTLLFLTIPKKIAKNNNKLLKSIVLSIRMMGIAGTWTIYIKGYSINKWLPNIIDSDYGIIYWRTPNMMASSEGLINFIFSRLNH